MKKILPFLLVFCMCLSMTTLFVGADAPQKYTIDFSASDNLGWAPNAEFSIVEASAKLTYQEKSFGLYTWGKDNNKGYTPQNILDSHYHMYFKSNKDGSITTDFHYMVVEYSAKTSYADAVKIQILHGANFHILGALTVDSVSRKDGTRARTQAVDVDQKITRDPNSGGTGEASLATTTRLLNREVAMSFTEDTTADADYRIYSISFFNNQATADAYAAGELSDKDFRSGYTIDYSNHEVLSRYVDERDSFRYGEDAVELIYEDHEEHTYPNINVTQYDRPWWMGNENWQSWANVEDSWYHWIMQKNKGDLFSTKLRYMVIEYSIVTSYEGEIKIGMINGGTVHVAGAQIVGTVAAKDGTLSRTDPVDISDANGTKFNFIPRLSANQMVNVFFTGDNTTDAVYKIHNVYFYENESDAYDEHDEHLWSGGYDVEHADADKHWHWCTIRGCKAVGAGESHSWNLDAPTQTEDKKCTKCGWIAEASLSHQHEMTKYEGVQATCTTDGIKDYWVCSKCGLWYEDEAGTKKIEDHEAGIIASALGHTPIVVGKKDATITQKGYTGDTVCQRCEKVLEKGRSIDKLPQESEFNTTGSITDGNGRATETKGCTSGISIGLFFSIVVIGCGLTMIKRREYDEK